MKGTGTMADDGNDTSEKLRLVEITLDNYQTVMGLKTRPEDVRFIGGNAEALADCAYVDGFMPRGVYRGDVMVGFVVWGPYHPNENYHAPAQPNVYQLNHVMIDAKFQGQGLGRRLIDLLIRELSFIGDCDRLVLSVDPKNQKAIELYRQADFKEIARDNDGDIVMAHEPQLD